MIASILQFVLGNFTLTLFVLGVIASAVHIFRTRTTRSQEMLATVLLNYFILFSVGISFAYNFVLHSFFGKFTAQIIDWVQSPFQLEVAFASLGFSLVGFMAFPSKAASGLKQAAILGITPLLWGAGGGHIYQIITTGNMAPGNSGVILYSDLLLPAVALALYCWYQATTRGHRVDQPLSIRRSPESALETESSI